MPRKRAPGSTWVPKRKSPLEPIDPTKYGIANLLEHQPKCKGELLCMCEALRTLMHEYCEIAEQIEAIEAGLGMGDIKSIRLTWREL